ncbi:MAG: sensor histidine kinase, partial [Actinomycetota bacterium]
LRVGLQQNKIEVSAKASLVAENYVVLVLEDRTRDLKMDRIRRDFIGNISHELKTPIGAISLLAEALQGTTDPGTIEKFTSSLLKESARLTQLVQDVIELSRLQSAEVLAEAESVEISSVISDAVERNEQLANSRGIRILADQKPGIKVFGNRDMLTMAIRNLVENAVVYSEPGSQVGIGTSLQDGVVSIAVTDSGVGISAEDQERIFERFYRVDPSRSRETGGTGLGLSIVKHVAKIHRGEIKLFSQLGVGSTFTLRLPAASDSDPETGTIKLTAEDE